MIPPEGYEAFIARTEQFNSSTTYSIRKAAKEFDKIDRAALLMRARYLVTEMNSWYEYIDGNLEEIPYNDLTGITDEMLAIHKALKPQPMNNNKITDEMIAQAKAFPVDKLVQFTHGKARCFNHNDKLPTMYHATRNNTANCPACNLTWNPIDILVKRDGLTFSAAVRRLCQES